MGDEDKPAQGSKATGPSTDTSVAVLVDMGFSADVAHRALQIKEFNVDQALHLLLEKGPEFVMEVDVSTGSCSSSARGASSSKDIPQVGSDSCGDSKDVVIPENATVQDLEKLREQALMEENYEVAIEIRDHMKKIQQDGNNGLSPDAQLLKKLEQQKEQAAKEENYEQALQLRDEIRKLKLKMHTAKPTVPLASILGKRERPKSSSPFSFAKFAKKQKQDGLPMDPPAAAECNDSSTASSSKEVPPQKQENAKPNLFAAASAHESSGASSSTDVPPQPKVEDQESAAGTGSASSKDAPPKKIDESASSGSKDVPPPVVKKEPVQADSNAPEKVKSQDSNSVEKGQKNNAKELAAESTKASSGDAADKASRGKKKKVKAPKETESSKKCLEVQRQSVAEVKTEKRKFPTDLFDVPQHASTARFKHADAPKYTPHLNCIWNNEGEIEQASSLETLLDVTIGLNKDVCKKALEYWWHQGRELNRNECRNYCKWKSRFDHLCDYSPGSYVARQYTGALYDAWDVATEVHSSGLRSSKHDDYVMQSLQNVKELKSKVLQFLSSIDEADEFCDDEAGNANGNPDIFWGAIDERAISSLALPTILMQDPKMFGTSLHQKEPNIFEKWFPVKEATLEKCQEVPAERDMLMCLDLANISEELVKAQRVSHWFRDGSVADQPFLFQQGRQRTKSFCEKCGQWVADRPGHLKKCLTNWNYPGGQAQSFQSMRMFQQKIGLDIGVTIQFKYVDKDNVQVKLCAEFESLLRSMMYMSYWPHDGVTARWRILKNQSCSEDIVTDSHRRKQTNFTMISSLDMDPAPSPDCFVHKLKGAQPNTLSWMYEREGRSHDGKVTEECAPPAFKGKHIISRRVAGSDVKVEVEVEHSYDRIRGGILGDQVGYGKTACMIALIAQTSSKDQMEETIADWEKPYAKEYIFTNATLIVTPPNLFDQWSGEFKKFVDKSKCDLKILTICNHTYMKRYTMADFVEADVVLVSFRFFFSDAYRKYFDKDVGSSKADDAYYTSRIIKCRHRVFDFLKKNKSKQLLEQNALFEAFYWKRVVFDEFHEVVQVNGSCSDSKLSYCFMRQLHSRYHWGLTATPLLENVDGVRKMASLLHIFLPPNLDREHAQHFVHEYIRANKWNVATVKLEEKWMKVVHTPAERALYTNQEQNTVGQDGINNLNSAASERLLQFCSHFCPDGQAQSVGNAIERVRADNFKDQDRLRKDIKTAESNVQSLKAKEGLVSKYQKFVSKARSLYQGSDGIAAFVHSSIEQLGALMDDWMEGDMIAPADFNILQSLNQAGRQMCGHFYCKFCSAVRNHGGVSSGSFQAMIAVAERVPVDLDKQLKQREAALRYLHHAIKSIRDVKEGAEAPECSLCLEEMQPEDTAITKCGHAYHESCLRDALNHHAICPLCRSPTTMQQCTKVKELSRIETDPQREQLRQKVGSKIMAIVDLIKSINKSEKILIFIQWNRIRDSLVNAIQSGTGFKPHVLEGDTFQRNKILKAFQEGTEAKDQVMMLSIEQSASGVNLVCANHCILVHPMFGNHQHATDCEKQAIGRIRRQGQQRTCFVYRFYTEGTIEERLMKEHSKELKDLPMPDDDDEINVYKEPPVAARPVDAHVLVSGKPRCGTCKGNMDFCAVGSEHLKLLNDNRKCLQGDVAKQWVCDKCQKEFDSETTNRYACVEKPECDYDLCEECHNAWKCNDLQEFTEIVHVEAKYKRSSTWDHTTLAVGLDSRNRLVFQRSGEVNVTLLEPVTFGDQNVQGFQRRNTSYGSAYPSLKWYVQIPYNAFERGNPPAKLGWYCRFRNTAEKIVDDEDTWHLIPSALFVFVVCKDNTTDLLYPFNVVDPELMKRREKQKLLLDQKNAQKN